MYAMGLKRDNTMTKQAELELCYQQGVQAAFEKEGASIAGALGAYEGKENMRRAGMSDAEIAEVLSVPGGALRGYGKEVGYGIGGTVGGTMLGGGLGALSGDRDIARIGALAGMGAGALGGFGYGMYSGYQDELERARIAILEREAAKRKR
jgi:hypothetical protein